MNPAEDCKSDHPLAPNVATILSHASRVSQAPASVGTLQANIWMRTFIMLSAILLLVTGFAKLVSSFGSGLTLQTTDPILALSFRSVFRLVGALEIVVAIFCCFSKKAVPQILVIAWLATGFLIYRMGLVWIGYQAPCPCAGNLTDSLHVSPRVADLALRIILAYLVAGSYVILLWLSMRCKVVDGKLPATALKQIAAVIAISLIVPYNSSARFWTVTASVDHVRYDGKGSPLTTNREIVTGFADKNHFLILTDPSGRESAGATTCAWDGKILRWYEVRSGRSPFPENNLSSNTFVVPSMDSTPVPRQAVRSIQCISLLMTPPELIRTFAGSGGSNYIRIDESLHLPEIFSTIDMKRSDSSGGLQELTCRTVNWAWMPRGNYRERIDFPEPLNKGFIHWTLTVLREDRDSGLPAEFEFKKYFYNIGAIKDRSQPLADLVGSLHGTIDYKPRNGAEPLWIPELPTGHALVYDYRKMADLERLPNVVGLAAVMHAATNSVWALSDPPRHGEMHAITVVSRQNAPVNFQRRWTVLGLLVAVTVALPVLLLASARILRKK